MTETLVDVQQLKQHLEDSELLLSSKQFEQALLLYQPLIKGLAQLNMKSSCAPLWNNQGVCHQKLYQYKDAQLCFEKATQLEPENTEFMLNLATIHYCQDHYNETEKILNMISIHDSPNAYGLKACLASAKGDFNEACDYFEKALQLDNQSVSILSNYGNCLLYLQNLAEAEKVQRTALALDPNRGELYANLGMVLNAQRQFAEGLACYQRAYELDPRNPQIEYNLAMSYLSMGDYDNGWPHYEVRWQCRDLLPAARNYSQPRWDGLPLAGRTLYIYAEQGFGDTLQFIRYVNLISKTKNGDCQGKIIVECQPELVTLLKSIKTIDKIVTPNQSVREFDCHCAMLSLPLLIKSMAHQVPYLHAIHDLNHRLNNIRLDNNRLKVGLVWAGSPRDEIPRLKMIDMRRSISLKIFEPLFSVANTSFYSLQMGQAAEQTTQYPFIDNELIESCTDFNDTAALIQQLDLVIAVDTAVAHLAGALGKPVWILSRYDGCWRWLGDQTNSPWYPSAKIFHQQAPFTWPEVIQSVYEQLKSLSLNKS